MSVLAVISSIFFIVLFQYLSCFAIYVSIKLFYFSFRKCQYNIRLLLNEHFSAGPRRGCSDTAPLDLPKVVGVTKERMISVMILGDIFLYLIVMGININILTSWLNTSNIMQCINLLSLFIFYLFNKDYFLNNLD